MTRRQLFGTALALAAGPLRFRAGAQAPIGYRDYFRCLPDYLSALAADAYSRRNARVAALESAEAIREYQAWARRTFLELAGPLPERTPLGLRTTGAFERPAYRVEKVVYESRPGFFVTADLYLPKDGTAPHPGVLFQMGHSGNGKGYDLYQRCCQGLVQLGYVVLAFDPMGQGERIYYPRPGELRTRLRSVDDEHTIPGGRCCCWGRRPPVCNCGMPCAAWMCLASHPLVDRARLASTGQSGGATLTMLLAAADPRLAAAAVCSGNTENFACNPFLPPGSADDAEQDLVASGPRAFDRWDLLWPLAPKPLLVATSARDFFGTYSPSYESSGREEFAKLARAYAAMGAPGNLGQFETPLPHGLSYSFRVAVYNWFERHLKGSEREITEEPPTKPEADEPLWCGPTGSAVRDFGSKTPFLLFSEQARGVHTPDRPADLRALLGMDAAGAAPRLEVRGATRYSDCNVQAVEVNTAAKVWAPAWLFTPRREWTKLLLIIEPSGRNGPWREGDLYPLLAGQGIAVCAADVRGVGDLAPQFGPGAAGYAREHQNEENYAWASLILGHSLLGQRAADIIGMAQALGQAHPNASITVAARGVMTVPALCAAALEPRIVKLYLAQHLVSWRALVEAENYTCPLANFVPGVLAATDLPQIAQQMAPRQVIVAGLVDAAGRPLAPADSPYADTRPAAAWDVRTLAAL